MLKDLLSISPILESILENLDIKDLLNLIETDKDCLKLKDKQEIWNYFALKHFNENAINYDGYRYLVKVYMLKNWMKPFLRGVDLLDKTQFINLNCLTLMSLEIQDIPKEIESLENLEIISFWDNDITFLPETFIFNRLHTLDLGKNKFSRFPEIICKNKNLKFLYLNENSLTFISENLSDLDLIYLNVDDNRILFLPEIRSKSLSIKNNRIIF